MQKFIRNARYFSYMTFDKFFKSTNEYVNVKLKRRIIKDFLKILSFNDNITYEPTTVTDAVTYAIKLAVHYALGDREFGTHH